MSNDHAEAHQYAREAAETYGSFFGADTSELEDELVEYAVTEAEPADPDYLEDTVEEAVQDRFCALAEDPEYGELFTSVDNAVVGDEDVSSVYKEDVLEGVMHAGVRYLQDEEDVDVGPAEDVELWFGPRPGTYDWGRDIVRVGEQQPSIEYEPEMLGLMVHELYHRKQFQDKVEDGVEAFNELASRADGLETVTAEDPVHRDTGVLMQSRGDYIEQLVEQAQEHGGARQYLSAAVTDELERYAPDETDPFDPTDVDSGDSRIFGWEEEVVPHIMYLRAEGLEDDPAAVEEYLEGVVQKNTGGDKIVEAMRERL